MSGFLSADEVEAIERLLEDARHEARVDERAGRTEWAAPRWQTISDVRNVVERHQAMVRAERELPVGES